MTEMITLPDMVNSGGDTFVKRDYLFVKEPLKKHVLKPDLTGEEKIVEEITGGHKVWSWGPGTKVVDESGPLVVVRDPTTWEKLKEGFKETMGQLTPGKVAYAASVGVLLGASPVLADDTPVHGSVEVMAGGESATLDTKLILPVTDDVTFFNRNRMTATYTGADGLEDIGASSFHVNSLSYDVGQHVGIPGLDMFAEVDVVPGTGIDPRAGLQYFAKVGDLGLFQLASVGLHADTDLTLVTSLGYTPELTDDVGLVLGAENLTIVGEPGHIFSTQRLRAGVDIHGYQLGFATDLVEAGDSGEVGYNIGGFVKVSK